MNPLKALWRNELPHVRVFLENDRTPQKRYQTAEGEDLVPRSAWRRGFGKRTKKTNL
jgi:hypothetical protein